MTAPFLTEDDPSQLKWQTQDKRTSDRLDKQQNQDTIVPAAAALNDSGYYSRLVDIRNSSANAAAGQLAVDQAIKTRETQIAAAKQQREWAAAQAAAYNGADAWAMGNPDFGALQYSNAAQGGGQGAGGGWGSGGAQGVANVLRAAGFPESAVPTMMAIAMAESSWNPNATHRNSNGSVDNGLFQINTIHRGNSWYPSNPMDPYQSAVAAYNIWRGAGGTYRDWTVYNSGAYRKYLQAAPPVQQANIAPYAANTGSATGLRAALVSSAQRYIGLPYIWGGTNLSRGVDCSGLVQSVYAQLGLKLPRTAQEQANWGTNGINGTRTSINNLQAGDLVAWNGGYDRGRYIGHIAIYAGNGEIIESPDVGLTVRRRKLRANENAFGVHLKI